MNPQPPFITAVFLLTRGRKMSDNHRQKIRRHLLQQGFGAQQTAGQLVKRARLVMGAGTAYMANQ